ncbi:MAG: TonB-dependent receptor [Pseudomonadota bacterium]
MNTKRLLGDVARRAFAVGIVAFAATSASAQDDQAADQEDDQSDRVIIVTGQKIERDLQEIPASVVVVDSTAIQEQNLIDLDDVIERLANVTGGASGFNIRGINSNNVSGAGQSELATIYVDGSPLPSEANAANGALGVWDLEQIEVFRGPQSTLQGRNALAGAIILNTANPTPYFDGRARVIVGNELDERRFAAAIGGPIAGDELMFRTAFEFYESDGLVESPLVPGNLDETSGGFIRTKLLYEPNWAPDLSVLLAYTHDERNSGIGFADLSVDDPFNNRVVVVDTKPLRETKTDLAVLTIDYDFTGELSLTSISSLNKVTGFSQSDGDFTAEAINASETLIATDTFSQELRLNYDGDRFKGVIGGYYAYIETPTRISKGTLTTNPSENVDLVGLLSAPPAFGGFGLPLATAQFVDSIYDQDFIIRADLDNPVEIESYAIFGDFSYELVDRLTLFGGFRYDQESQSIVTGNTITLVSELPDPAGFGPLAPVIAGVNQVFEAQALAATREPAATSSPTFSAFLPKFGLGYQFTDDLNANLVVQRGYRSGGVGINNARAESFTFDQEFTWNYEFSVRSQWLDNTLTVNANVYYIDWTDQQVTIRLSANNFDTETQNAGASRLFGFEIETEYEVTPTLDIYASVGYADTEFTEFIAFTDDGPIDLSGNRFNGARLWTAAGGATYRSGSGVLININGDYQSSGFATAELQGVENRLEGRFLANLRGGWQNDNLGVFLTVNNIFNKEFVNNFRSESQANGPAIPTFANFGDPRVIAIQLEASF